MMWILFRVVVALVPVVMIVLALTARGPHEGLRKRLPAGITRSHRPKIAPST